MSKIACAGGHSKKAPGASSYLDEYAEDRKVNSTLVKELRRRGHKVANCSNEAPSASAELALEVSKVNKSDAKLSVHTHLNCFKKTKKEMGVETFYFKGSKLGKAIATAVSRELSELLGLPNRGAKATTSLYVLRHTNTTAILPEICFVDSKADADAYRRVGAAKVAAAIADGIESAIGKAR